MRAFGEGASRPGRPLQVVGLAGLIYEWRNSTGNTIADLAEDARIGVGYALVAAKGGSVPEWVETRIRKHVAASRRLERVDIPW